jgi:hypothetical protein
VAAKPRAIRASREDARRSLPSSSSSSAMVAMMLVTARPVGVLVSTPFPEGPDVDTASGQFMQSSGDFPDGSSESIYCDDDELVAFAEPADAFGPARSITTGAPGCGIGEDPIRNDSCSRNGILLLVDGLLSGGDPEIGGNAHPVCNKKSPIINPVSDPG